MKQDFDQSPPSMFFIDKLIGDHFIDDPNTLFRVRVMISSWVLFLVILVFFSVLVALLPMKVEARLAGFILSGSVSLLLLILLFRFRRSGNYLLYARLSVFVGFTGIALSVFLSESPITSPSIGLFYIVPLLAVFFLGQRGGYFWIVLTLLLLSLFFILELFDFPFPAIYDEQFLLETKLSSMMLGMLGMLGMVYAYEYANIKLRQQRDLEYQRLDFLANHDELTGLANRNKFETDTDPLIMRLGIEAKNEKLALIYMDLDGFKPVNDEYGHEAGDQVLREVADRIGKLLKNQGHVARHGGDEFIILLQGIHKAREAEGFAEHLKRAIQEEIIFEDYRLKIDASMGIAIFPRDAQDISSLIKHADMAMYHAKNNQLPYVMYQDLS